MKIALRNIALLSTLALASCGGGGKVAPGDAQQQEAAGIDGGHDASAVSPDTASEAPDRETSPDRAQPDGESPDAALSLPDAPVDHGDGPTDRGDVAAPSCHEVTDGHSFVDPRAGADDDAHTGARGCPHRSLTRALARLEVARAAQGAAAPDAVITIVNDAAGVTLGLDTGETFPLAVPARVTITSGDHGRPAPTIRPEGYAREGISLTGAGWHLSHVVVACDGVGFRGVDNHGGGGAMDHVVVEGCGHGFVSAVGQVAVGPGVQIRRNTWGFKITGGTAIVTGGAGAEHTSFSDNKTMGIWIHGGGTVSGSPTRVQIDARNVTTDAPDVNDVSVEGSMYGVYFDLGPEVFDVRGLRVTGNGLGIFVPGGPVTMKVRGSFLANNARSALRLSTAALLAESVIDLGRPGGTDDGGNTFEVPGQASAVNAEGTLCIDPPGAGFAGLLAVGNIFGRTDCRHGGAVTRAATCESQVGVAGAGANAADVSGCFPAP